MDLDHYQIINIIHFGNIIPTTFGSGSTTLNRGWL